MHLMLHQLNLTFLQSSSIDCARCHNCCTASSFRSIFTLLILLQESLLHENIEFELILEPGPHDLGGLLGELPLHGLVMLVPHVQVRAVVQLA